VRQIRFAAARQYLKKHQQDVCVVLFLMLFWLAPAPIGAGLIALLIVFALQPYWKELLSLRKDCCAYLKAFVKLPRVQVAFLIAAFAQVLALIKHWWPAYLFNGGVDEPTLQHLQQFSLEWVFLPPLLFLCACTFSIGLRWTARATKHDPDLSSQRQMWSGLSLVMFFSAFVGSIYSFCAENGPVSWFVNWLVACGRDAYLPGMNLFSVEQILLFPGNLTNVIPPAEIAFASDVRFAVAVALFLLLLPQAFKLANFLTSVCWRVVSFSPSNLVEAFVESLRMPGHSLLFKEKHPRWLNAARSFWWLTACYLVLLYLFGFSTGPLGHAISQWLDCSTLDANFVHLGGFTNNDPASNYSNLRIFLGSIIALYATVPLAVSASVFLPFKKSRKIVINADGISVPDGPYASLWFRPFRLWNDLRSVQVKDAKKATEAKKTLLIFKFRSGGSLQVEPTQLSVKDLEQLLGTIDERAANCVVQPEVFATLAALAEQEQDSISSDGTVDIGIRKIEAQEFKSTVFVPLKRGDWLASKRARIIRQLATKPLCAVYLARLQSGNLAIVKQFYLAQDNEETRALSKIFQREYDLLRQLEHPGISKVLDSFADGDSTFLVIEHRPGTDLKAFVAEHGPRSEAATLAWAKQLAKIMIYLHSHDPIVLHRDLTPDNIVVGEDGQLRLIDFGAARQFLDGITGTMIGKQCYMAPEQIKGQASPASDIYAFGCTLHFLLTAAEPIALSQSAPATICDVSDELDQLIRSCTEFDEEKRPSGFVEILKRLNDMGGFHTIKLPVKELESIA